MNVAPCRVGGLRGLRQDWILAQHVRRRDELLDLLDAQIVGIVLHEADVIHRVAIIPNRPRKRLLIRGPNKAMTAYALVGSCHARRRGDVRRPSVRRAPWRSSAVGRRRAPAQLNTACASAYNARDCSWLRGGSRFVLPEASQAAGLPDPAPCQPSATDRSCRYGE